MWLYHLFLLPRRDPAFFIDLAAAGDGQRFRGNVVGHGRAGGDIGILPDADRSNQLRIRADKGAVFDDRGMLLLPVIVARDDAGSDVDLLSNGGVAQVSEMLR